MSAATLLRDVFGFDAYRPGQQDIVEAVTNGKNTLAIMPTGGGKSLCFQLPAIVRDGVTVVISPLIALMRDQVRALKAVGVEAGALTSGNVFLDNRSEGALFASEPHRRWSMAFLVISEAAIVSPPWELNATPSCLLLLWAVKHPE